VVVDLSDVLVCELLFSQCGGHELLVIDVSIHIKVDLLNYFYYRLIQGIIKPITARFRLQLDCRSLVVGLQELILGDGTITVCVDGFKELLVIFQLVFSE